MESILQAIDGFLDEHAVAAIGAAAIAFLLKLGRDFVVEKSRQAASLRIVAVYIRLAVEAWEHPDIRPERAERRIVNLCTIIRRTLNSEPTVGSDQELFTPFVPFSPHDNLTVAEVRDFLGFLDSKTIEIVVDFIQAEALTHALAADFRSEYVRRQFDQKRKVKYLLLFNKKVVEAYDAGQKARKALEPLCPQPVWWVPFGYRFWRWGVCGGGLIYRCGVWTWGQICGKSSKREEPSGKSGRAPDAQTHNAQQ